VAEITIHPSMTSIDLDDVLAASLRANRLDPKLLYVTPRQAELWREVSLKHVAEEVSAGKIHLVGLGPGTGLKEAELASRLQSHGREVRFTAIDVSRDLVEEASKRVAATGASADLHLVCDLAELDYLKDWLDADDRETPRFFTFFGVVPNLEPMFVAKLLRELLRPGDVLLASVHLAPVSEGIGIEVAMNKIVPQYDNAETLAWLGEAMEQWKLTERMQEPRIVMDRQGEIPCLRGMAFWKSSPGATFQLFFSLRYTPELFEELLRNAGVQGEMLAITACREEAIWAVRR
jgi:SAM-dependent methyltransferase